MNGDPTLSMNRAELVSAVNTLARASRPRRSARAALTFDGHNLLIETPSGGVSVPAQGQWSGKARLPLRVLMSVADDSPTAETLTLAIHPCRFSAGRFECPCTWKTK